MLPACRLLPSLRVVSGNRRHDLPQIGLGDLGRQHDAAVADDCDFVTEIENLREPVRHVDDPDPQFGNLSNDGEEALYLSFGQCSGRFVEDQDRARQPQRLGDFHHLLVRDTQLAHGHSRGDSYSESLKERAGLAQLGARVDQSGPLGFAIEKDIVDG